MSRQYEKTSRIVLLSRSVQNSIVDRLTVGRSHVCSAIGLLEQLFIVITFRVSRRRREMYSGQGRLCVCLCVCP